jgi:hypothetical protein
MKALNYWCLLAGCCIAAGCHNAETAKTVAAVVNPKSTLPQPFRYHKLIEVAPGMDYDVLSWGRGPAESSAYMILRSDSAGKKYAATNGDLDGKLVDAFNTDLDTDGNPEIFVQSQSADSTHYEKIDVYEFNGDNAHKLDFPKLTSSQKKGYHGGDDFSVKENKLIRTYPIYDGDNAAAKPTGQKRTLEYSFHSNDFSVKQISTDSTTTATKPQPSAEPAKAVEQSAKTEKHSSKHHSHHESHHESRHHHESERKHHSTSRHHESGRKHHHRR